MTASVLLLAGLPYGGNTYDWIKHWAILDLLTNASWPVSVDAQSHTYWLRYYIAGYLPAALTSAWLPWIPAAVSLTVWLGLGLFLLFQSLHAMTDGRARNGLLLAGGVLLASGLDFFLASNPIGHTTEWATSRALDLPLQLSSPLTQLVWTPQQAIAGMLVALLIGFDRAPGYQARIIAALCLLLLWSPFALLGLVPAAVWVVVRAHPWRECPKTVLSVLPIVAMGLVSIAYLSSSSAAAKPYDFEMAIPRLLQLPRYLLAFLIELGPLLILLGRDSLRTPMAVISLITLLGLALITGSKGDLIMRGSIGPVFLLAVMGMRRWLERPPGTRRRWARVAITAMLITSGNEVLYLLTKNYATPNVCDFQHGIFERHFRLADLESACGSWVLPQYLAEQKPAVLR